MFLFLFLFQKQKSLIQLLSGNHDDVDDDNDDDNLSLEGRLICMNNRNVKSNSFNWNMLRWTLVADSFGPVHSPPCETSSRDWPPWRPCAGRLGIRSILKTFSSNLMDVLECIYDLFVSGQKSWGFKFLKKSTDTRLSRKRERAGKVENISVS